MSEVLQVFEKSVELFGKFAKLRCDKILLDLIRENPSYKDIKSVAEWNDSPSQTKENVVAMFKQIIKELKDV